MRNDSHADRSSTTHHAIDGRQYVSLFQEAVLTALTVSGVQLTACAELLLITNNEVEARARALLAAQNAAYARATDGQAVM